MEGVAGLYGGWYWYGLGAPYPPSPIFVVNVVKRGDNPLSKVYKKISGKNFGKKEVLPPHISGNEKKILGKKTEMVSYKWKCEKKILEKNLEIWGIVLFLYFTIKK